MLIRISRALLWVAAAAALAALFGPDQHERWLSVTAAFSLLAAFAFWRTALLQRRLALQDEPMPSTHLDETALMEIAVLCSRCCADARSVTALVEDVARLLKLELGSRSSRGRVIEPGFEFEAIGGAPRGSGIVIETRLEGRTVAVIELSDMALAVAPNALNALIDLVRSQIAEAIRRLSLAQALEEAHTGSALQASEHHHAAVRAPSKAADIHRDARDSAVISSRGDGPPGLSLEGRHVLVVGENQVLLEVVRELLRRHGCRWQQVADAEEGLRELCDQAFDLVLVDVGQPALDTRDALRSFSQAIRSRYPGHAASRIPVVALGAAASGDASEHLIALGFADQLLQPLCPSDFKAMLNRLLRPVFAAPADAHEGRGGPGHLSSAAGSVLDEQALQRLRELDPKGENNLLERVFKAFETSVARLMPQLQESLRTGDHAGVRHVAHTLKSSTASIGATRLSHQCAEIESMIRLDDTTSLDSRVHAMCTEVEVVLQEVRRLMNATG
jgi:CheY-like chemotaxis protein